MKKRILFLAPQPFFQWRGSPIRIKFNLLALVKLGYEVDLITLPIGETISLQGTTIYRVANPFGLKNIAIGPSIWKIIFDFFIILKAISLCRKHRYEVIHGVEEAGFIAAVLAGIFKTKAIFEKHSDPFSYKKGLLKSIVMHIYGFVEKVSVRMSDGVICTGPGLVKQVEAMNTSTQAFNIFDIPSSLKESSEDDFYNIRRSITKDQDEVLITFVGSFAIYQGVDLLFASIPQVVKNSPQARFVIIGGNSEEIAQRQARLGAEGVDRNVTFLGKIAPDSLPDYLAASDILLSPRSSGVNTPLKILDYLKAGRSIVATDIPSNRLLLDEQSAVFAKPEPSSFSNAILSLVGDRDKREQLGSNCRIVYKNTFTFDHHCQRLANCYGSLTK